MKTKNGKPVVYIYGNKYRIVEHSETDFRVEVKQWFRWKPMLEQTHLGKTPIVAETFIRAYDSIRCFILLKEFLERDMIPAKVRKLLVTKGFY